jgi:hypothetical protein
MKRLVYALVFVLVLCAPAFGQTSEEELRKYVPVLPSVKANFWKIDPAVGYAVKSFDGGVYVISDDGWQSAFLVTDEGVIVFDAPASFGKNIPAAIAKVTDKPIKILVYSHSHKDHIGGSAAFKNISGLQIVALEGVSDFLKEMNDPDRLLPNVTFKTTKTLKLGGKTVELSSHHYQRRGRRTATPVDQSPCRCGRLVGKPCPHGPDLCPVGRQVVSKRARHDDVQYLGARFLEQPREGGRSAVPPLTKEPVSNDGSEFAANLHQGGRGKKLFGGVTPAEAANVDCQPPSCGP